MDRGHLGAGVVVVREEEQLAILPANGQHLPGGVPGGGGDLGRGVGGDADVLRGLAIVGVHGDIAAPLLRVGSHLPRILIVIGKW